MSLNYALIGCGRISSNHIAAAKENKLNIIALCDIKIEKAKNLMKKLNLDPNVKIYSNYKSMIKENQLDLIAIATESGKHAQIALDCLRKDINLIIEKPIALSLEDADKIIEESEKRHLKVSACHQNRFNKSIQKLKEAIDNNKFGKLMYGTAHIRWKRDKNYYDQASWRGTWDNDGGALMNQCIHNIDLLRWIMGSEIDSVYGVTKNFIHPYIEAEDVGLAIVKFKNGALGTIEGSTSIYPKNLEETLYIFGEKGTFKAGGKSVNIIEEWLFDDEIKDALKVKKENSEIPPNIYGFGHTPLYRNVIESIKYDKKPYVDAIEGKNALELVLAIYKSSFLNELIKLPLSKESTLDFLKIKKG